MTLYPLRVALGDIWRDKWVNLLCVLTIATGLFLLSVAIVVVHNVELAVGRLPGSFSVNVYLLDKLPEGGHKTLMGRIEALGGVREIRYITKDEALREMRTSLEDSAYVLEGLEGNPLPDTLVVWLDEDSVWSASVEDLAARISELDGVEDVQYGRKFLAAIERIRQNASGVGFAVIALLLAAVVFVSFSTVKILLYRKTEEIRTQKLLGATKWFIRLPFLIEGGILGLIGGVMSMVAMTAIYGAFYGPLVQMIPMASGLELPMRYITAAPVAGLVIGVLGALMAMGRIRF